MLDFYTEPEEKKLDALSPEEKNAAAELKTRVYNDPTGSASAGDGDDPTANDDEEVDKNAAGLPAAGLPAAPGSADATGLPATGLPAGGKRRRRGGKS